MISLTLLPGKVPRIEGDPPITGSISISIFEDLVWSIPSKQTMQCWL